MCGVLLKENCVNKAYLSYLTALHRLPIENPTEDDLAQLFPHLTKAEAVEAFARAGGAGVASPPLRVRDTVHVILRVDYPGPHVFSVRAVRVKCAPPLGKAQPRVVEEFPYTERALRFANKHWRKKLIPDTWDKQLNINLHEAGETSPALVLFAAHKREVRELMQDRSHPQSEIFDAALVDVTLDPLVGHELSSGHQTYWISNCGYCGGSLGRVACTGCGSHNAGKLGSSNWHMPLSKKVVDFLRKSGHVFTRDPALAQEVEREVWFAVRQEQVKALYA